MTDEELFAQVDNKLDKLDYESSVVSEIETEAPEEDALEFNKEDVESFLAEDNRKEEEDKSGYTLGMQKDDILEEIKAINKATELKLEKARESGNPDAAMIIKSEARKQKVSLSSELEAIESKMPNVAERVVDETVDFAVSAGNQLKKLGATAGLGISAGIEKIGKEFDSHFLSTLGIMSESEFMSDLKDSEKAIENRTKKHEAKYGKDALEVGATVGEYAPDLVAGVASKTKKSIALAETALSTSRQDFFKDDGIKLSTKMATVGADVFTAVIGAKVFEKVLPKNQSEELMASIKKVKDPEAKKQLISAMKVIDESDIKSLDYDGRSRLFDKITKGELVDDKTLGTEIRKEVVIAKEIAKDKVDEAYLDGADAAMKSRPYYPTGERAKRLGEFSNDKDWNTPDGKELFAEFKSSLKEASGSNAEGLESLRKSYVGKASDTTNENTKRLYKKMTGFIGKESDELFDGTNPYIEARKLHGEFVDGFKKGAEGMDAATAAKFDDMLTSPKANKQAVDLFHSNVDANVAESYKKIVKGDKKILKKTAWNLVLDGIDEAEYKTKDGMTSIIKNFFDKDPKGMVELIGREPYNEMKTNMNAMSIILEGIEQAEKAGMDKNLLKSVTDLGSAAMLSNVSPYVSTRIAVHAGGDILKKTIGADRGVLMKKLANSKGAEPARKLMQGLMLMKLKNSEYIGDTAKEITDPTPLPKSKMNNSYTEPPVEEDPVEVKEENVEAWTAPESISKLKFLDTDNKKVFAKKIGYEFEQNKDLYEGTGVTAGDLVKMAEIESKVGSHPSMNKRGSYKGVYQLSKEEGKGIDREDNNQNIEHSIAVSLPKRLSTLKKSFSNRGIKKKITAFDLYMAHQQGAAGYTNRLSHPNSKIPTGSRQGRKELDTNAKLISYFKKKWDKLSS